MRNGNNLLQKYLTLKFCVYIFLNFGYYRNKLFLKLVAHKQNFNKPKINTNTVRNKDGKLSIMVEF